MLRCGVVAMLVPALAGTAAAQGVTGAIQGRVVDVDTGKPLAGVDVTVAHRHVTTDREGTFRITGILPGHYDVWFEQGEGWDKRPGIVVAAGATTEVNATLDFHADRFFTKTTPAPGIDPHATAPAYLLDGRDLTDVPQPGLTFDDALGGVPGSQGDGTGVAFWGSSSLENRDLLDGADLTELQYGGVGSIVPLELLDQLRVTGGGSTGALVQAVTKHGTNDWHGGVFGSDAPSWLVATPRSVPQYPATLDITGQAASTVELGGELAGPIVRDHLWFYVAAAPMRWGTDYTRRLRRQVDRDQNGEPDLDPRTGFPITEVVASDERSATTWAYPLLARLDGALTPEHQGTLSLLAVPETTSLPGLEGLASTGTRTDQLTTDLSASWRSELLDDRLDLDAMLGWHRASTEVGAIDPSVADQPLKIQPMTSIAQAGFDAGRTAAALAACHDDPDPRSTTDPYPLIDNCPLGLVDTGGPGLISRDLQDRFTAALTATARVHAAGLHEVSVGLDARAERIEHAEVYSGGYEQFEPLPELDQIERVVALAPPGTTDPRFDHECLSGTTLIPCEYLTSLDQNERDYGASGWAASVRDHWQLPAHLALVAGLRVEAQRIGYPSDLRRGVDPLTGLAVPDDLLRLHAAVAPEIGVAFDPTSTGRAKLFAHWQRSFETVPLDVVMRSTGVAIDDEFFSCSPGQPRCLPGGEQLEAGPVQRAVADLEPEYLDEAVAGGQVAAGGAVLGLTVRDRRLGRVIEDVGVPGLAHLELANPGEGAAAIYDRPQRVYDALELTAAHRLGQLYLLASYTYSRTRGDYPGSISYDNGQIDPNVSSQYDLLQLAPNHLGYLPLDRPHYFKLDAAYTLPVGQRTAIAFGARFRALSGMPEQALAADRLYGPDEVYLLPRGSLGRTPFTHELDLHLAVRRALAQGISAELYADVFNVYDQRDAAAVDSTYAPIMARDGFLQSATPISGGSYSDLIWAKALDGSGNETRLPLGRNPDFHHPVAYYNPMYARIGFRLVF